MTAILDSRRITAGKSDLDGERGGIPSFSRVQISSTVVPFLLFLSSSAAGCAMWSNTCPAPSGESIAPYDVSAQKDVTQTSQALYALRLRPDSPAEIPDGRTQTDNGEGPVGSEESVLEMLEQDRGGETASNSELELYPDSGYLAGEAGIFSPLVIDGYGIYLARPLEPLYLEI